MTITEKAIQALCLLQSAESYDRYEDWAWEHSSGIVDRIRGLAQRDLVKIGCFINTSEQEQFFHGGEFTKLWEVSGSDLREILKLWMTIK